MTILLKAALNISHDPLTHSWASSRYTFNLNQFEPINMNLKWIQENVSDLRKIRGFLWVLRYLHQ